jgi:hypothetical protein
VALEASRAGGADDMSVKDSVMVAGLDEKDRSYRLEAIV